MEGLVGLVDVGVGVGVLGGVVADGEVVGHGRHRDRLRLLQFQNAVHLKPNYVPGHQ